MQYYFHQPARFLLSLSFSLIHHHLWMSSGHRMTEWRTSKQQNESVMKEKRDERAKQCPPPPHIQHKSKALTFIVPWASIYQNGTKIKTVNRTELNEISLPCNWNANNIITWHRLNRNTFNNAAIEKVLCTNIWNKHCAKYYIRLLNMRDAQPLSA